VVSADRSRVSKPVGAGVRNIVALTRRWSIGQGTRRLEMMELGAMAELRDATCIW
jgi:hypothetical protein